jgi:hypothetical protein
MICDAGKRTWPGNAGFGWGVQIQKRCRSPLENVSWKEVEMVVLGSLAMPGWKSSLAQTNAINTKKQTDRNQGGTTADFTLFPLIFDPSNLPEP